MTVCYCLAGCELKVVEARLALWVVEVAGYRLRDFHGGDVVGKWESGLQCGCVWLSCVTIMSVGRGHYRWRGIGKAGYSWK